AATSLKPKLAVSSAAGLPLVGALLMNRTYRVRPRAARACSQPADLRSGMEKLPFRAWNGLRRQYTPDGRVQPWRRRGPTCGSSLERSKKAIEYIFSATHTYPNVQMR